MKRGTSQCVWVLSGIITGLLVLGPLTGAASARIVSMLKSVRLFIVGSVLFGQVFLFMLPSAHAQGYAFNQMQLQNSGTTFGVADFNLDGIPDLLVPATPLGFAVSLGKNDGSFGSPLNIETLYWPAAVCIGDFNGDGKPDVAAVVAAESGAGTLSVYLGNGDGTFRAPNTYPTGTSPSGIVTADFNGDGKLDLAVLNAGQSTVSVYTGNGDGTFQNTATEQVTPSASLILTADLNQDGRSDIITFNNSTAILSVLLANADGTFQRVDSTIDAQLLYHMAVGDFNSDGKPDLISPYLILNGFALLLGNGDGTFQAPIDIATPALGNVSGIAAGDFNRDGNLDVALFGEGDYFAIGSVAVVLGNGNGTFSSGTTSPADFTGGQIFADFNGDGIPDLLTGASIELGAGDGTFANPAIINVQEGVNGPALTGDFNGDGNLDVAFPAFIDGNTEQMAVLPGNGNGTFQNAILSSPTSTFGSDWGLTTDLNGDGKLDAVYFSPSEVAAALGNGDGTFGPVMTTSIPNSLYAEAAVAGDFNGDGKSDLAIVGYNSTNTSSDLQIMLSNGDGTFTAGDLYPLGKFANSLTVADFNRDGRLDLAVPVSQSNVVDIFLGNGNGTFQQATSVTSVNYPLEVVAADLNHDGNSDLIVNGGSSSASCRLSVLYGNGNATFQNPVVTSYNYNTGGICGLGVLSVNDVNGDGIPDLVATISTPYFFLGHNDGTFSPLTFIPLGPFGSSLIGDFNDDGTTDLGSLGYSTGSSSVLELYLSAPAFGLYPANPNFGFVDVGTSSSPLTMNLLNLGGAPFNVSSITPAGEFSQTSNCVGALAAQASCPINVVFSPTESGNLTGSLTIADSLPGSPQVGSLTGTGAVPVAEVAPSSLTFDEQVIGGRSPSQQVTISNSGNGPLDLTAIAFTGADAGDFGETNACGGSVPSGSSCVVNVSFTPLGAGKRSATLTVTDNSGATSGTTQSVDLAGTGITLSASPTLTVDFFGDGEGEPALFRPSDGTWYVNSNSGSSGNLQQVWGEPGDVPVSADYDGDGKSDFALFRPSNATWYVIPSSNPKSPIITAWGSPDDVPVPADYDGDGKTDIAVWRPSNGTWYILPSDGGAPITKQWGQTGDVPVIGDYDGDGKADYAVFRPSNGAWYVILSSTGQSVTKPWGQPGDIPVEGDYEGDGKTDYAVWRPDTATWYVSLSSTGKTISQAWGELGDIPVVGDYNGDGKSDYAVFRPSNATWYIDYSSGGGETIQWGETGDIPATHLPSMYRRDKHIANFDGDRKADIGIFRPSTGTWYVIPSSTGKSTTQVFGENGDIIVPGDYDGDGKTDYAVWRPSNQTWYVTLSSTGKTITEQWGASGDIPVPGDYDGDGKTDFAVFRPSTGTWHVILSSTGAQVSQAWGASTDIPVPADYDGDGKTDYAVFRPSTDTWYVILSSTGQQVSQAWGASGDIPVPGDYDGDTKADFAVFRPSNGTWYILQSSNGKQVTTPFGTKGDIPVAKDYDGDEKTDIAVFRPSNATWYILQSSNGQVTSTQWGTSTDVPVQEPVGQLQ